MTDLLGVGLPVLAVVATALLVAATVQSVVGIGLGLVAAPVTALVAPELMPGLLIALAVVLPVLTLVTQHHEIDWRGLAWSMPTRLVGTAVGVWVVAQFSSRSLGIAVGVMVLAAVLLTWRAVEVPVNRATLAGAGLVSGVAGTATSIGGPPFALLYQHRSPAQVRSTMAIYFMVGAAMSLVGLGLSGELTWQQARAGAVLAPVVLAGVLLAVPLRRRLPASLVRPAVLVLCGTSASVLLVRSLVGG